MSKVPLCVRRRVLDEYGHVKMFVLSTSYMYINRNSEAEQLIEYGDKREERKHVFCVRQVVF